MELMDQLRYVRQKMKLTQEQLSKETGISKVTIARWESCNIKPRAVSYGKFVDFCEKNDIILKDWFVTFRRDK